MQKSKRAFFVFLFFVSSCYFNFLYSQQTPDSFIRGKLNQYKEKIITLQGDMTYIIEAQQKLTQQGKFYYQSPDKLRMDFYSPASSSIIQNGLNAYLKSYNHNNYTKVSDNTPVANSSDLFGFNTLSFYQYSINRENVTEEKVITQSIETQTYISPIYYGFQNVNNEKILSCIINYDIKADLIYSYKLIGNELMPQSTIHLKSYREVEGLKIPLRIECLVRMSSASMRSIIILDNVKLNEKIDSKMFDVGAGY